MASPKNLSEIYVRTCQECGHKQQAKPVAEFAAMDESWRSLECNKCKSESMDYGSFGFSLVDGKIVKKEDSETEGELE